MLEDPTETDPDRTGLFYYIDQQLLSPWNE